MSVPAGHAANARGGAFALASGLRRAGDDEVHRTVRIISPKVLVDRLHFLDVYS
jgi:hypothetical protein